MSPIKRTQRATAKQQAGRGRHARPAVRSAEVPPELASQDYEFPHVTLPASRPLVDAAELLAVLDDDTQVLDLTDMVVDDTPQPAHADGLAPIPVPSLPFLNAAAPVDEEPTGVIVRVGNALPAPLTAPELMLFGRPIPLDAPPAVQPEARPQLPRPVRRSREHALVFASFDDRFWQEIDRTVAQVHAAEPGRATAYDEREAELAARVARLDAKHHAFIEQVVAQEYAGALADSIRPLPVRVPGAAKASVDAGERVSA